MLLTIITKQSHEIYDEVNRYDVVLRSEGCDVNGNNPITCKPAYILTV